MKISQLIKELSSLQKQHGDLEVTCTATCLQDLTRDGVPDKYLPEVWESTVETLIVTEKPCGNLGKRVRLYL